jgi:hypothetical protein
MYRQKEHALVGKGKVLWAGLLSSNTKWCRPVLVQATEMLFPEVESSMTIQAIVMIIVWWMRECRIEKCELDSFQDVGTTFL